MSELQSLLDKFATLHRRQVELQYEIAAVTGEIFALGKTSDAPKKRRKRTATADIAELVKPIVKALQQAGEPLKCQELAMLLEQEPLVVAYRLRKGIAARFIEKAGDGRYRASSVIPVL